MNFGEFIPQLLNPLLVTFHNDCNTIIQNMNDICGNEMWYENKMDILVKTFDTNIRNHMVCILADRLINQISINAKNRFDKYSSRLLRHNLGFIAIQQGMLFIDAILLMVSPSSHESLFIKITPDIQLLCKSISYEVMHTIWFNKAICNNNVLQKDLHIWINMDESPFSCNNITTNIEFHSILIQWSKKYPNIYKVAYASDFCIHVPEPIFATHKLYTDAHMDFIRYLDSMEDWVNTQILGTDMNELNMLRQYAHEYYMENIRIVYNTMI